MLAIQYDLFEERPSEVDELRMQVRAYKESSDRVRKGIFAKHGDLVKRMMDLEGRMQVIEKNICQQKC
jgi:hypothetical protein